MTTHPPTVLVVEDEPEMRELLTTFLRPKYRVKSVETGTEAMELVESADAMLLDRRLPGMMGAEVLGRIRRDGNDIPVGMVSAVDPTFDILEMEFDDYLTKPVGQQELLTAVHGLIQRLDYDAVLREYLALASKVKLLESEKPRHQLDRHEGYVALRKRFDTIKRDARATLNESVDRDEVTELMSRIEG